MAEIIARCPAVDPEGDADARGAIRLAVDGRAAGQASAGDGECHEAPRMSRNNILTSPLSGCVAEVKAMLESYPRVTGV